MFKKRGERNDWHVRAHVFKKMKVLLRSFVHDTFSGSAISNFLKAKFHCTMSSRLRLRLSFLQKRFLLRLCICSLRESLFSIHNDALTKRARTCSTKSKLKEVIHNCCDATCSKKSIWKNWLTTSSKKTKSNDWQVGQKTTVKEMANIMFKTKK